MAKRISTLIQFCYFTTINYNIICKFYNIFVKIKPNKNINYLLYISSIDEINKGK